MKAVEFIELLEREFGVAFFSGVPDSLLSPFTTEIMKKYGISERHIVAANEGNATALAAGYHLSTGNIPCVYMQNSGQGNMFNPYASLMAPEVYKIPCIFVVGWRGQPGTKDEPQHIYQGRVTDSLMDLLGVESLVLTKEASAESVRSKCREFKEELAEGKCVAFIVEKGALESEEKVHYHNSYGMKREDAIRELVKAADNDVIVCTTGKASRELFEIREQNGQSHKSDFMTVGSMGHCSSIALELALNKKDKTIWCIDGDGAALMHMGAMAVIGANAPENLIHVLINNEAHETVGGMPTVAGKIDFKKIAQGCGYQNILQAETLEEVEKAAREARQCKKLTLIEIKAALGARKDLGRPTTTAEENKQMFMEFLKES